MPRYMEARGLEAIAHLACQQHVDKDAATDDDRLHLGRETFLLGHFR